ncbi:MAG TPA: hypothetical protein VM032_01920 [Vicinamibacterales bacterium]|nr:hypothetical protein [Vicinamibacterales bacterium]
MATRRKRVRAALPVLTAGCILRQAYTALLKAQAKDLDAEIHSIRLHPRYAPLLVDTPFDLPMIIDGAHEVEQLDDIIEQLRHAVERLSSDEALQEVRGAIHEYREAEKRQKLTRRRRR